MSWPFKLGHECYGTFRLSFSFCFDFFVWLMYVMAISCCYVSGQLSCQILRIDAGAVGGWGLGKCFDSGPSRPNHDIQSRHSRPDHRCLTLQYWSRFRSSFLPVKNFEASGSGHSQVLTVVFWSLKQLCTCLRSAGIRCLLRLWLRKRTCGRCRM